MPFMALCFSISGIMKKYFINSRQNLILIVIFFLVSAILLMIPTGFESRQNKNAVRCRGRVLNVDSSNVQQHAMVKAGDQTVELELLDGRFKGEIVKGNNPLLGQMDRDKIFAPGDTVLVVLSLDDQGEIVFVNPQEHYRIGLELLLLVIFAMALIGFGGWTGIKALMSFALSALMLWKILLPLLLKGYDPIMTSLIVVACLTAVIMFLVAGFSRKGLVAFGGAFLGVLSSCLLAWYFTGRFHVHGAVMPFASTLLYSGFGNLDLTRIFIAAVFIAASGAVMDLAMDVSASMQEIAEKRPDISSWELVHSGISIGRAVVGTMTTTLLFAYSGGYITLLMAFMAQGVPLVNLFNIIYVSTEVLKTLVGSFGLVMVAPFTAIIGGFLFTSDKARLRITSQSAKPDNAAVTSELSAG